MAIKLICIDMDGTLLKDDHNIAERDKEAIKSAISKGVHVAITTGRVYNCAKLYSKSIGLKTPIIASNGAFIGDTDDTPIYCNPLSIDDIKEFLIITKKYGLLSYLTANWGLISMEELPENNIYKLLNKTLPEKDRITLKVVNSIEEAYDYHPDEILKGVCISNGNKEDLIKAKEELKSIASNLEIVSSWNNNFEVMKKGSSKGEAVEQLTKYLKLNRDEVMCIGDSENDLTMLKFAGTGVAMGNAIDSVKEAADFVTSPNTDCGVAKAIEKFVLI